jgi:IS605 OrfB family transposase
MLLTLKAKLNPTDEQRQKLLNTMETFNAACDDISRAAYESKTHNKIKLQHRLYYRIREQYKLPAQLAIRAIGKVAEGYTADRRHLHFFNPHGAVVYDQRIMSFKGLDRVSLTTIEGRIIIPLLTGGSARLGRRVLRGQADLVYIRKEFYLCLVVEQPEEPQLTPEGYLGVDLGIVKLASTSDGDSYSGEDVDAVREHYAEVKAELQRVASKNSKRKLRRIAGRESRFKRYTNHVISKGLVAVAEGTKRALALEDLKGIRSRTTVRSGQRDRLGKWAFGQLRGFVEYKAKVAGVPVLMVDPRNTSRRCSRCGYVDKRNRVSQSEFRCRLCGFELNAARNIQWRADVNQPIAVCRRVLEFELQAHHFRGG